MGYYNKDAVKMVINFIIFIIALLVLSVFAGCRTTHVQSDTRDSVRYEVRYVQRYVYDTINVEIPHVADVALTRDSLSVLENEVARSEAEVTCGYLRHTLESKPSVRRVAVVKEIVKQDTIIYKDREVQVERVIVKPLPLWERAVLYFAPVLAIACVFLLIRLKMKRQNGQSAFSLIVSKFFHI